MNRVALVVVLCFLIVSLALASGCGTAKDPRITSRFGPFVQPARHLILPEGERELLVYDCLAFDASDYWPETASMASTCFEFYQVTCDLPAYKLISYYIKNLTSTGWAKDERATVMTEDSEFIVFQKEPYLLAVSHYEEQGIEMFSLWRSPCEPDWEERVE